MLWRGRLIESRRGMMRVMHIVKTIYQLGVDLFSFIFSLLGPRSALVAENLFLRKQLALYQERNKRPGRINSASRFTLVALSRLFDWQDALAIVQPKALIRWHRERFRLFWRWKSRKGRPRIPEELKYLIRQMTRRTLYGARNGSRMSFSSNWAFRSRLVRFGSTCQKSHHVDHVMISAGPPSCTIMLAKFWHVTSLLSSQ